MLWRRKCENISLLQYKRCEREENGIVTRENCSMRSGGPVVRGYSAGKKGEALILFPSSASKQMLRDFWTTSQNGRMEGKCRKQSCRLIC